FCAILQLCCTIRPQVEHFSRGRSPMKRPTMSVAVVSLVLLVASTRLFAHHAFATEFDKDKKVTMTGTVAKMDWKNPHVWMWVDIKGKDGKTEQWGLEFGAPNALFRRGWTKSSVPIGGQVTITGYLAKDGRLIASAENVMLPDGKTLFAGSAGTGAPSDSA